MKASDFYHGREQYNCAQAILRAFRDRYNLPQEFVDLHKKSGNGGAPGGICGALYAVHLLLKDPEKISLASKIFRETAGSDICIDIREEKKFSCWECVDLAADILEMIG